MERCDGHVPVACRLPGDSCRLDPTAESTEPHQVRSTTVGWERFGSCTTGTMGMQTLKTLVAMSLTSILAGCLGDAVPTEITIDEPTGEEAVEMIADPGHAISFRGIEVVVPVETGGGAGAAGELEDGWVEIEVENRGDGVVAVKARTFELDALPEEPQVQAAFASACSDGAFALHRRWHTPYRWHLSTGGNPTDAEEAMIRRGANNIVLARNDCGLTDQVSATHEYKGRIDHAMNISSSAECRGQDGMNVVGMGGLDAFKAYTCWYWNIHNHLVEADIKFKKDENWITTRTVPAGCEGRLHLESVATHEMGHVFGLLHPAGDHPKLTMQAGGSCDASKATLGFGDVRGLEAHY